MMMKLRLLRMLIKNIERTDNDIYDISIVYNGNDIGNRVDKISNIKYDYLDKEIIRKLYEYINDDDDKFSITLYQSCEFKSDLLIFINQNWYEKKVGE